MEHLNNKQFNLNNVKASIVECAKVAGTSEQALKESDFDAWQNDYTKSWQIRFVYDLQSLQKSIKLVDDALLQKDLVTVDDALRDAVVRSNSLATTFELITSDLMHLRQVLKNAAIASNCEH